MTQTADAIVIGAGVIGAAIALELNRTGLSTVSIDRNPAAGYGPTSSSCAIIRVHYSTLDGTAFAYEGYHYWRDWEDYLGAVDQRGTAEFIDNGCLVMCTEQNGQLAKHTGICDQLSIPYQRWNAERIKQRLPIYNLQSFAPARRLQDPDFGKSNGGRIEQGVFFPTAGYISDPQLATQNLQCAAEKSGGRFLFGRAVTALLKASERVSGVRLDDGSEIHAPIVINVAGPWSATVNALAGALHDMTISTRALKQEVVHLPAPEGFDFYRDGLVVSDNDIACYVRPEKGNYILVGSEDPECDPREWVDADDYQRSFSEQATLAGLPLRATGPGGRHPQSDERRGRSL